MSKATPWVLTEVRREVTAQDGGHPRDYEDGEVEATWGAERAEQRAYTEEARRRGIVTWRDELRLLADEVLAEPDPVHMRAALVALAAGATRWVECIDRRAGAVRETGEPVLHPGEYANTLRPEETR